MEHPATLFCQSRQGNGTRVRQPTRLNHVVTLYKVGDAKSERCASLVPSELRKCPFLLRWTAHPSHNSVWCWTKIFRRERCGACTSRSYESSRQCGVSPPGSGFTLPTLHQSAKKQIIAIFAVWDHVTSVGWSNSAGVVDSQLWQRQMSNESYTGKEACSIYCRQENRATVA